MLSHYEILEIPSDADKIAIRRAYIKKALKEHPDKFQTGTQEQTNAVEQFKKLVTAYEVLYDEKRREAYDRERLNHETLRKSQASSPSVLDALSFKNIRKIIEPTFQVQENDTEEEKLNKKIDRAVFESKMARYELASMQEQIMAEIGGTFFIPLMLSTLSAHLEEISRLSEEGAERVNDGVAKRVKDELAKLRPTIGAAKALLAKMSNSRTEINSSINEGDLYKRCIQDVDAANYHSLLLILNDPILIKKLSTYHLNVLLGVISGQLHEFQYSVNYQNVCFAKLIKDVLNDFLKKISDEIDSRYYERLCNQLWRICSSYQQHLAAEKDIDKEAEIKNSVVDELLNVLNNYVPSNYVFSKVEDLAKNRVLEFHKKLIGDSPWSNAAIPQKAGADILAARRYGASVSKATLAFLKGIATVLATVTVLPTLFSYWASNKWVHEHLFPVNGKEVVTDFFKELKTIRNKNKPDLSFQQAPLGHKF